MTEPMPVPRTHRLSGLDGLRGLAALFVVLHHCWLFSYPGFPANTGPWWTGPLVHGHLAVVLFIVLSGFSLAVAPARRDWQLGGTTRFLRRRAWRILPPYWAALAFSVLVATTLAAENPAAVPDGKSVLVYGALVQDAVHANSPNSAFWSIAVEAQLYLVFPLLLLLRRRIGAAAAVGAVLAAVLVVKGFSDQVPLFASLLHLTPEFAVLFTVGVVAAGVLDTRRERLRRVPWAPLAGIGLAAFVLWLVLAGPVWTVNHYFAVDLVLAAPIGCLLAAVALGAPAPLVRLLDTAPVRGLGRFSYSLYLVHVPIVTVVSRLVVPHLAPAGTPAFLVTLVIAVPAALVFARLFAAVFELPFVKHRSARALRAALGRKPAQLGQVTAEPSA